MNIILIADEYIPLSRKVQPKMQHELAVHLVNEGHNVTALMPTFRKEKLRETIDGVDVIRYKIGVNKNTSKVRRLISELSLSRKAWKGFKNNYCLKPELVVYFSPPIFFGKLIQKIKRKYNATSYLVLRDFFPQWVIDQGMIKEKSLIAKFFRHYEQISYESADKIGVMSPENLKWFNQYTCNKYKNITEVLYNWVDKSFLEPIAPNKDFRRKYNLESKTIMIYGGNIGHAQDMMNIVRLGAGLQHLTQVHIVIIGQGDEYELVESEIKRLKLENITLLPGVSQNEYFAIQKISDIGLFCLHRDHKTHNFPGKILGYLAQGLPVLGCVNSGNDLKELINDSGAGLISVSGEDSKLLQNAINLIHDTDGRENMRKNSLALLVSCFSVDAAATQVIK
ncbi:glycosyltransferase WbuB [Paraphotobacterium marinum]|uniref:Glycosyltransferase WbuB n=1 Tax=Paraphotobacterium marinum TaxID=1755811 RepID=A0A220VDT1_9GAMM|nr:glycosyltransferase family 4 protein [Paraphotobacterium marinum]ASK78103.1 glycosyltransferase WbuB [Paraphotobacterium marinum]